MLVSRSINKQIPVSQGVIFTASSVNTIGFSLFLENQDALNTLVYFFEEASLANALPTCSLTTSSATVVCTGSTTTAGLAAGMSVVGPGVPDNTNIASITNSTTFVLTNLATLTQSSALTATMWTRMTFPNGGDSNEFALPAATSIYPLQGAVLVRIVPDPTNTYVRMQAYGDLSACLGITEYIITPTDTSIITLTL